MSYHTDATGKKMEMENKGVRSVKEIMDELDSTGKYGEKDTEKLMNDAEKIRGKEIKAMEKEKERERKKQEKIKKAEEKRKKKIKGPGFKEVLDELDDEEWSDFDITKEIMKKRDLRRVFKTIARNQPVMVSKIRELLDWTDNKKPQSYEIIKSLKEMGLIEEKKVLNIWAKDYAVKELGLKAKLTKEQKEIMDKFNFWTKSMKEKTRDKYIGVSGYWKLTEKGVRHVEQLAGEKK